jgi:hypothetical protein
MHAIKLSESCAACLCNVVLMQKLLHVRTRRGRHPVRLVWLDPTAQGLWPLRFTWTSLSPASVLHISTARKFLMDSHFPELCVIHTVSFTPFSSGIVFRKVPAFLRIIMLRYVSCIRQLLCCCMHKASEASLLENSCISKRAWAQAFYPCFILRFPYFRVCLPGTPAQLEAGALLALIGEYFMCLECTRVFLFLNSRVLFITFHFIVFLKVFCTIEGYRKLVCTS